MPDHGQKLSERAVEKLRRYSHDVTPDWFPEYGAPLPAVVGEWLPSEWLEAAVLAGYVPYVEGISLAVRGDYEWTRAEIREFIERDVIADALLAAESTAGEYRRLIVVLEQLAIELEQEAARLYRLPLDEDSEEEAAKVCATFANAAEERAARARTRLELLALDQAHPPPSADPERSSEAMS
jgi:hypothetical protein